MGKKVIKVNISGYYLVRDDLPDDVLGTATVEEFIRHEIADIFKPGNYNEHDIIGLVQTMLDQMKTLPTVRLELKE